MDKESITDQQYATLVDTLHRWGLDSPKLIAEMADHYAEKALDMMAAGHTWEQALNSIKTKRTYLELRRTQRTYDAYSKKSAGRIMLHEVGGALHPRYLLAVLALGVLSFLLIRSEHTVALFSTLLGLKNFAVFCIAIYFFHFHKLMRRVFRNQYLYFGWLMILDYVIFMNLTAGFIHSDSKLVAQQAAQAPMVFEAVMITLSYFCNVVAWRIFQSVRSALYHIPKSIFETLDKHEAR